MISISIQDLKPNPQDTSAFYLKQIYLIQADPNASLPSNSSAVAEPPVFSPPLGAIFANTLWFLSLVSSLSCAMVATLVQQWARRYIKVTQPARCNPQERARARAFFTIGVEKFRLPFVVEKLPVMVHLSLLLFLMGLVTYLTDTVTARVVSIAVMLCTALILIVYTSTTSMSACWLDCPYYTTFPSNELPLFCLLVLPIMKTVHHDYFWAWEVFTIVVLVLYLLNIVGKWLNSQAGKSTRNWIFRDTEERVEEAISRRSSELDTHVLDLTLDALGEDDAREKFLEFIPGFYRSDTVKDLRRCLPKNVLLKIHHTLLDFFSRTLSSNSVTGLVKLRRLATCLAAADEIDTSAEFEPDLQITTYKNWSGMPRSAEFGEFLSSYDKGRKGRYTQWMISNVTAGVNERDDRWIALAMDHLGIPEHVLRDYLSHGDSVILALVIHSVHHAIRSNFSHFCLLPPLSDFDVHNTLPGLQHEFCDLWNTLAQNARDHEDPSSSICVLKATRHIYLALHQGTDAAPVPPSTSTDNININDVLNQPSPYPLCAIPDHRPDSTIQVHDSTTVETSHAPAATAVPPSSESESLLAAESHLDDSIPHAAESPSGDLPPPDPSTPVESSATTSTHAIAHRPSILASVALDPPPLASASITDAPQHNIDEDRCPKCFSAVRGTLASPSLTSRPSDVLLADMQLCLTCATSQSDQSSLIPEHPPPGPAATPPPLAAHQGTSILDHNVALNGTELGVHADSRTSNPPASPVTTHYPHSTTSDHDMTGELSSYPLAGDPVPSHDSDHSQLQ